MIVGVLTTFPTQYTSDSSMCFFYLIEQHAAILLYTLQVLYMCNRFVSININKKPSPLTCYRQFGTNWIVVLMFVESQMVHI